MKQLSVYLCLILLLSGCAKVGEMFGREKDLAPPAPLPEFKPSLEIETLWQRSLGAVAKKNVSLRLTPTVYERRIHAVGKKGYVYALNPENGESLWETGTKAVVTGGPGTGEGLVLVGTREGEVIALEAKTGKQRWRARVSSEVLAAPRAADDIVVVRTVDGKVFGLGVKDGKQIWVYDRTVPRLSLRGTSAPVLARGMAICGFDSGRLVAISLKDGLPVWEARIAIPHGRSELERMVDIDSDPMVVGDTVYAVTFQGRIAAIDIDSGKVLWQRDMSSHAGLGTGPRVLYVTDEESHVWALDRFNSASLWRQQRLRHRMLTAPVHFGGLVVSGDFEGYLHWMRESDGQFVARTRVGRSPLSAPPMSHNELLLVYDRSGTLSALRVMK